MVILQWNPWAVDDIDEELEAENNWAKVFDMLESVLCGKAEFIELGQADDMAKMVMMSIETLGAMFNTHLVIFKMMYPDRDELTIKILLDNLKHSRYEALRDYNA